MSEPINRVASNLGMATTGHSHQEVLQQLAARINDLIQNDFNQLISILYRMDIDENKLRRLLKDNKDKDAGLFIANMMIERELQKIKSRQGLTQRDNNIDEDEKW